MLTPVSQLAAFAEFSEQDKGTLTNGRVTDLAVLSPNIFTVPMPKLLQTESVLTMVNGVVVYDAGLLKKKDQRRFLYS